MTKTIRNIALSVVLALLPACHKVQPQGAANKHEANTEQIALIEANMRLAEEADRIVVDSAKTSGIPYVLEECGFWYHKQIQTEGDSIKRGMEVEYSATIRNLENGRLIADITEAITIGQSEAMPAIQYSLLYMCTGEEMAILAPYYCAYGRNGKEGVPPLTNVRINIKANNIIHK